MRTSPGSPPSAHGIVIAAEGVAAADIVTGASPSPAAAHAAGELAGFLKEVTGARFRVNRSPGKARYHVLVGPDAAIFADEETDKLGDDGMVMRTTGRSLVLTGHGERGTLYAVFSFLEDVAGCRWWSPGSSTIPHRPTLAVPPLDRRHVPTLEYRYPYWADAEDPDWAVRNKSNGPGSLAGPGYGGFVSHGGCHTFTSLVPVERYFNDHPEWFSLVEGRRVSENWQLCLTNWELLHELLKSLRSEIDAHPQQRVFSVSQNDWAGWCECSDCRAVNETEGCDAGTLLTFVNAVAAEIERSHPGVKVSTLAYCNTRKVPRHVRPRANVIIQLCSFECDFSVPLADARNREFRDDIIAWAEVADSIYIWDYAVNFSHYFMPYPNLRVLDENIRFFVEHGVRGIFEQGAYNCPGTEFSALRAWVLAKLLWDPGLQARPLIETFCEGYYGSGAEYVLSYIELLHAAVRASGEAIRNFSGPRKKYLSFGVLSRSWGLLGKALESVSPDRELGRRIELLRMTVLYAFICDWDALRARCVESSAAWPLPESIEEAAADFRRSAEAGGIPRVYEWKDGFGRLDQFVGMSAGAPQCRRDPHEHRD